MRACRAGSLATVRAICVRRRSDWRSLRAAQDAATHQREVLVAALAR